MPGPQPATGHLNASHFPEILTGYSAEHTRTVNLIDLGAVAALHYRRSYVLFRMFQFDANQNVFASDASDKALAFSRDSHCIETILVDTRRAVH